MLDFIRKQLGGLSEQQTTTTPIEDVPDETILEYAHVIQELDDLSIEGKKDDFERTAMIDIPLEDDEIETIEFNIGQGRVTDIPADATVQESYKNMKTYEEFYQEAYDSTSRLMRESETSFSARVTAIANEHYQEYCTYAMNKGLFGFDKINISDERVPSKLNIDFGPVDNDSNKSFVSKVKAFFATDKEHNITKKQLDSVNLVRNGAFTKIGTPLMTYMESNYDIPTGSSVWDICTPKTLIVPKGNNDSFCVVLEYTNEITGKNEYFGWTCNATETASNESTIDSCEKINMESFINETQYENRDIYIQECANVVKSTNKTRPMPSRFFQEAIDFGGDSSEGDGGSDLPPVEGDGSDDSTSTEPTSDSDTSVDTGNASDAPESNDDSTDKADAGVNDVSQEIAEKVVNDTQDSQTSDNTTDTEITFDDDSTDDSGTDVTASVDDQLDELDNSMSDESNNDSDMNDDMDMNDDIDIENMTIDQMIEQGSEKLKSMTIAEIKKFISSNDSATVQEAFILTKKNINKELDICLRKCLGDLNDDTKQLDDILKKFKKDGSKLNRVLTKAAKMKDIYSSDEQKSISDLNKTLVDLLSNIKKATDSEYVAKMKKLLKDFVSKCKIVGSFVEDKLNGTTTEAVQEAFLLNNVKDKITKALIPVKGNMEELKKLHDEGNLSRGRIVKRYSATVGTEVKSANMPGGKHNFFSGYSKYAINIDNALKLLNKAIRKKGVDEIELITALADKLDLVSDYIETVIDDNVENKEIIKRIGILSGELVDLINKFIGDDVPDDMTDNIASIKNEDVDTGDTITDDTTSADGPDDGNTDDTSDVGDNDTADTDDVSDDDFNFDDDDEGKDEE